MPQQYLPGEGLAFFKAAASDDLSALEAFLAADSSTARQLLLAEFTKSKYGKVDKIANQDVYNGMNCLHFPCSSGLGQNVNVLIEAAKKHLSEQEFNQFINKPNETGWTPLHSAVAGGYASIVVALIANGANSNVRDMYKQTPLLLAAEHASNDVIAVLLHSGADINATDKYGWTALMNACWWNYTATARLLLEKGADAAMRSTKLYMGIRPKATALDVAKMKGNVEAAEIMNENAVAES